MKVLKTMGIIEGLECASRGVSQSLGHRGSFRVEKGFRAKTTSINETVRETCHQYAVFLENLWVLQNMGKAEWHGFPLGLMKRPVMKVKEFNLDFVHLLITACDHGPPKA